MKKHKSWFYERSSNLWDERKLTKLQWLQDPGRINWGNLNTIEFETISEIETENLKNKINKISTKSKSKIISDLYRERNEFMEGY
jgi:hypothetical protein